MRYRSARTVPGENPPLRTGCELGGTGVGVAAVLSDSRVGVSRMATARPHEEQKRTFSEETAPHLEQVTIGRIVSHRVERQWVRSVPRTPVVSLPQLRYHNLALAILPTSSFPHP